MNVSITGWTDPALKEDVMKQRLITLSLIASLLAACGGDTASPPALVEPAGVQHSYVDVNGVTLHVVTAGQGEPVVLLHGWPQTWYEWRHLIPELVSHGYSVIAPDLRGLGDSSRPASGYNKKAIAEDIHQLVRKLGHERVSVLGHDWGGVVAYAYAAQYPEEVRKLGVVDVGLPNATLEQMPLLMRKGNPVWHFGFHAVQELPEQLLAGHEEEYLKWFFSRMGNPEAFTPEELDVYVKAYSAPGAMHAGLEYYRAVFQDIDEFAELTQRRLPMPVLAVGGEQSWGPGVEYAMRAVADNVQGVVIPHSGHWVAEEQPGELFRHLQGFLSSP
jgi:pimeloyl-ACP methyl ester carboxylesterase